MEWEKIEFFSRIHGKRIALTVYRFIYKGTPFVTRNIHLKWEKYHIRVYVLHNFDRHQYFTFSIENNSFIQFKFTYATFLVNIEWNIY